MKELNLKHEAKRYGCAAVSYTHLDVYKRQADRDLRRSAK